VLKRLSLRWPWHVVQPDRFTSIDLSLLYGAKQRKDGVCRDSNGNREELELKPKHSQAKVIFQFMGETL
jgi:hypothetical protein